MSIYKKIIKTFHNKQNLICLILLLLFILFQIIIHFNIVVETPFHAGDDTIIYFGYTNTLIENQGISLSRISQIAQHYDFTPLMFILTAILTLITGLDVVAISCFLIFIQIFFITILFFFIGKELFQNQWISLITTILFVTHGDQLAYSDFPLGPFSMLRTGQFSFIMFLMAVYLSILYFKKKNNKLLPLIFIFCIGMVLFHHQSGIVNWIIFFIFFFLSYLLVNLKKIPVKKLIMHLIAILFVFLLPAVILFIANIFLKRKIFDSLKSVFLITTGGGIEEDLNIFTLNYIEILGGIVLVTSILGFVYLIINWKKHKIALALIISFLFVILIGIYQSLFGFHFFPRRLLAGLHIPAELLAGFYFIFLWKNKNKFLISLSVVIILICGLGNYYGQLKDLEFDLNWEYFETTNWASENLKENSKIMSDVLTIVQFQNISGKTPTFTYPRTKDHMQNNKAEAVQKIIVEPNAENAASYMKNNNVKYMIIDSEISPLWSPGNYEKFKNEEYFEEIYKKEINEDRFIIIYQIK